MKAAVNKTYISRRMLDRYSEQRRQQQESQQQPANTAPATGKAFAEDNDIPSQVPTLLAPIEEEKKEPEQTGAQQQEPAAATEAKVKTGFFGAIAGFFSSSKKPEAQAASQEVSQKKRRNSMDRNLSCDEFDSDELDGDLNLSDEDDGARQNMRKRTAAESKAEREAYAIEFDTNVFKVSLDCLQHKGQLVTGDAEFCSNCKGVFNKTSKLIEEEGKQIWNCEFCRTRNEVVIDAAEIPQSSEVTYLLEAAAQVEVAEEEKKTEDGVKVSDKISIVFCIDISGSMGSGNRLGSAKRAIASQINTMFESNGQRKLGLVAFDNEVEIIGDGVEKPVLLTEAKMSDYDLILAEGKASGEERMRQPICETKESLLARVANLQVKGRTALGPAVLASIAMASKGAPGSQVIVLTDGMANVGLGSFQGSAGNNSSEFYDRLGHLAEETGVMVNLVTIAGAEANIQGLQRMVELSGGQIEQVNPSEMQEDFAAILSQKAIATKVEAKVKLHKGLMFRNELETDLTQEKTVLTRKFGNVTTDTMFTFEYGMKPISELLTMEDFDMATITEFPFQTQIVYTDLTGAKCLRVISQSLEVSNEREELAQQADADLVQQNCVMQGSKQARAGNTRKAQAIMKNFQRKTKGMQGEQWSSNRADFQAQASEAYSAMNMQAMSMKAPQQQMQQPDLRSNRRMKKRSAPAQMMQQQQMDPVIMMQEAQMMQAPQQQSMQLNDRLASQMYQMSTKARRSKY